MIQHYKTAKQHGDFFICDGHSNDLIDSVDKPTPYEERRALQRDRNEVAKARQLDRKQKRKDKRSQAY